MKVSTSLPIEVMKMALESIAGHKFRSGLTILGIVVGIITAVVVASILTGMRQSIVSIVEEGADVNRFHSEVLWEWEKCARIIACGESVNR